MTPGQGFSVAAIGDGTKLSVGRGRVFIDRLNTSLALVGAKFSGTVDALGLTPSSSFAEKRTMVDATNALLARVETERTLELSLTPAEWKKDMLALALLANTPAEYTQVATPVVGEVLTTSSIKDSWYWPPSGKRKLTAYAVKVSAVTKTEGTDYELDAETGAVYIKSSGSIADASTVTIDYTPTAITAGSGLTQINIGTAGTILAQVRFVAEPMTGPIHEILLYKVQFSAQDIISFLGQEFGTFNLTGTPLVSATPVYPNSTYGVVFQR